MEHPAAGGGLLWIPPYTHQGDVVGPSLLQHLPAGLLQGQHLDGGLDSNVRVMAMVGLHTLV